MGGGGLSLTAEEKLRVVHALDALGVDLIEAGFPASNPKEQELFELLAERAAAARPQIVAFGMTRRRERSAEDDEGLRVLADCFAPVCTLVGKASVLHVEKVVRVSREENLRDDRRLGRASWWVPASACCSTPSTSSTASRSTPATPWTACVPPPTRAPSGSCCATPTAARCPRRSAPRSPWSARSAARRPARHPHPRRLRLRGREHARGGRSGRDAGAGDDQRHRRAHRQRQPRHDHRRPAAEDGLRAAGSRSASRA